MTRPMPRAPPVMMMFLLCVLTMLGLLVVVNLQGAAIVITYAHARHQLAGRETAGRADGCTCELPRKDRCLHRSMQERYSRTWSICY